MNQKVTDAQVLRMIEEHGGYTVREMADELGIAASSMQHRLDQFRYRRLAYRGRCEHGALVWLVTK